MSHTATFITGEVIVALLFAYRSKFVRPELTALLWGCHLILSLLVLHKPTAGAWALLMDNPAPGTMFAIATATLALLLFTATHFHEVANPKESNESYLGIELDHYVSRRPWLTTLLLSPSLHAMTVSLFVVPILIPALHEWLYITVAAWCATLGLVFAIMLFNMLAVLRSSLIRLVRRHAIPGLIRNELRVGFRSDFRRFVHGIDRGSIRELIHDHLGTMAKLPADQQIAYLNATVAHWDSKAIIDARHRSAQTLASNTQPLQRIWQSALETIRGNVDWPEGQAQSILDTLDRVERSRAEAVAGSVTALADPRIRERVLDQLVISATGIQERWQSLHGSELSKHWVGPHRPLNCHATLHRRSWHRRGESEVLIPVMAILESVIELRFPHNREVQCSPKGLADLARTLQGVTHKETRLRLISLFAQKAIESTITSRHPEESLPMTTIREVFNLDERREGEPDELRKALRSTAFESANSYASEMQREELLHYLDQPQILASLIRALMHRCRIDTTPDAPLLRPYAKYFSRSHNYKFINDLDRNELYMLCRRNIDHFFHPGSLDWMLESLKHPIDSQLIARHFRHQQDVTPDFTLTALLLWYGTVKNISYSTHDGIDSPPELPSRQGPTLSATVRSAAAILDELGDGRGGRLLRNNPWVQGDPEAL